MKFRNKINFFLFLISIISLSTFKNANASLQDQYRGQTCTFNNAPFQDTKEKDQRYCINQSNKRIIVIWDNGRSLVTEGFLGKPERVKRQGDYHVDYYLHEWGINSNQLIEYKCRTNDLFTCADNVEIVTEAFKR